MLALPGRRHIRLGNHSQGEKRRQSKGVKAVGLLGGLSDNSQLLGMGQHDLLGQRLHEFDKPEVTGGRLDNYLERSETNGPSLFGSPSRTAIPLRQRSWPILPGDSVDWERPRLGRRIVDWIGDAVWQRFATRSVCSDSSAWAGSINPCDSFFKWLMLMGLALHEYFEREITTSVIGSS
jgi:hypothetical protein